MLKTNLTIGVKSYDLTLSKPCIFDPTCKPQLKFSFKLEGDFLPAASSDNINETVDYEQLCKFVSSRLNKPEDLDINNFKLVIREFSPLIHAGFVMLEVSCAHASSKDQRTL